MDQRRKGCFFCQNHLQISVVSGGGNNYEPHLEGENSPKNKKIMWLIYNNAILTKDNLVKRKWVGDERCSFCCEPETISHLLCECTMAKYVWSLVALVLAACCRPTSLEQFWVWIRKYLPAGGQFHMPGLAAICFVSFILGRFAKG